MSEFVGEHHFQSHRSSLPTISLKERDIADEFEYQHLLRYREGKFYEIDHFSLNRFNMSEIFFSAINGDYFSRVKIFYLSF